MKKRINIIFDDTIRISRTKYEALKQANETLKQIIIDQREELQEYKTFFENMKKLLDKQ